MNLINSIPYVAIQDTTAKATVYKYVASNSSWNLVGSAIFSTENLTGGLSMASYGGVPYVAVTEADGITAYQYSETATATVNNYMFEQLANDVFDGEYALDLTNIQSTANYIKQNCNVRPQYNLVDTVVGRFIRNAYNIELNPRWNPPVDDAIRETGADTNWVVARTDVEATLNGKVIKNLRLLNSDLSAYSYANNDNFLIIASGANKGNAVFCFYNNKIRSTIFSDQYLDEAYTITNCFQVWQVDEIADLQNLVSSTKLADGPMEAGSITFNNTDNEVIVG